MKILFLFFFIFYLFSCSSEKKDNLRLEEKVTREIESGVKNDRIFLGFEFGMSKEKVINRLDSLLLSGDLYDHNGSYAYDIDVNNNLTHRCIFTPRFMNGLYEMIISVKSDESYGSARVIHSSLVMYYMEKYGSPDHTDANASIDDDCEIYYWIDGNRQIKILCGIGEARIFYTDLPVQRRRNESTDKARKNINFKPPSDI